MNSATNLPGLIIRPGISYDSLIVDLNTCSVLEDRSSYNLLLNCNDELRELIYSK